MNRTGSYDLNHPEGDQRTSGKRVEECRVTKVDDSQKDSTKSTTSAHSYTRKYSQYGKNKRNKQGQVGEISYNKQ